nr:retrovirus-related Pol polyprotein from transposon TNT 1-94 [Tanacetum cinerariifolium]
MGLWYLKDTGMSLTAYADADHAGCQNIRRSTSRSAQFLGDKLVSWSSKKYVVHTGRVVVPTGRFVVPTARVVVSTSRVSPLQKEPTAEENGKWEKTKCSPVIQNGNSLKKTGRDHDGRVIILPPTTTEEHIAVQRESKARTTLLQSIPGDHVADFHYMDDAKDIWNAVKARSGGNAKSKKMRKSMLKQEFSEFRIGEVEGLHKGVHKSEQKAGRKIDFDKKESARLNKKKRYSSFKIKEIGKKKEYLKALITVDTLVGWTDHDGKSDRVIASKEFGMIAGYDTKDAINEGAAKIYNLIIGADTEEASTAGDAGKFAFMGVTSERISSKNLFRLIDSSISVRTKVGLGFNNYIRENELGWDDSTFSVFTTNYEDVEGRPLFNRFAKTDSMKVVHPPPSRDYTSLSDHIYLDESQMSYGTKSSTSSDSTSVSNDFVSCDDSDKSLEVNTNDFTSSDSSVQSLNPNPNDSTSCASTSSVSTSENEAEIESNDNPFLDVEDEGVFDSGCSRSMNGNKERLDDFQVFQGEKVTFRGCEDTKCLVLSNDFKLPDDSMVVLRVPMKHNLYTINLNSLCPRGNLACLVAHASVDETVKCHRRMGHMNYKNMNRLVKGNLVRGLPLKLFKNDHTCVACCKGKQHKATYKAIHVVSSISEPLQLLLMDLFGPTSIRSIDHKYYCLVITDDYYRFCWVFFLEHKEETYHILNDFINLVENQLNKKVKAMRYDNGTKFKNAHIIELYGSKGIKREYTVRTACYVLNRVLVTSHHNKTPYALLIGNIPSVSHFKPFGCHVTILNTSDHLGKFDGKADEGYIVGYSYFDLDYLTDTLAYKHDKANQSAGTQKAITNPAGTQDADSDSDSDEQVIIVPSYPSHSIQGTEPKDTYGGEVDDSPLTFADEIFQKELARLKVPAGSIPVPTSSITVPSGDTMVSTNDVPVHTSNSTDSFFDDEPTTRIPVHQTLEIMIPRLALEDPSWVDAIQEEMQQFKSQNVWVLVDFPEGKYAIWTKWILKNKRDARGIVVQNKAILVAQGHRQKDGIDYDEVFALVARIEAIRLFLAFASYIGFMVYQMDVKSVFLYERIDAEVYVTQPKGFVDPQHPKKVYKVVKALYGLHQAPRAWCATLSTFLLKHGYRRGTIDKTLFLRRTTEISSWYKFMWMTSSLDLQRMPGLQVQQRSDGMFISQDKYVQEILTKFDLGSVRTATTPYEAPKPKSNNESDSLVNVHLYRSMIGSLMYLTASRPNIMFAVSACSRSQVTPTTSNLEVVKKIFKYLKGHTKLGLWYPRESPFVLEAYSDSDYAGEIKDRKSTTVECTLDTKSVVKLWNLNPSSTSSMATLRYREEHNKVGYLLKPTGSDDYHQIIDFLRASYIRSPELGPPAIQATIDKTPYTITEDLVRSQLQLADNGGIDDLPIAEIYYGMDNLGPLAVALICLSDGRQFNWSSYIFKGMVSNIGNAKKFLMYPRFHQAILGIKTRITRQYKVLKFSRKLFANMRLNFEGHPMPLLAAMLSQDQEGEGTWVAVLAVPQHMPAPDQPQDHLSAPPRQQTFDPTAPVFEQGQCSDPNITSFSRTHETDADPFTNVEDEPLGGSFHMSPPRATQAPPTGQTSSDAEDLITLTALSFVVSNLVQKVNSLETELKDHMKLFKDVMGKVVKKVKAMKVKLKTWKRKMVVSDSDQEEGGKQDVDLDALLALANVVVTVDTNISLGGASDNPAASTSVPSDVPTGASNVPTDSISVLADAPTGVAPAGVSNNEKTLMVEEDITVKERTFKQMQADILGEQAAKRLHDEEQAQLDKQRAKLQRRRQQEVLDSAMYYTEADWIHIMAQVKANASFSKTLLEEFKKIQKAISNIQIQALSRTLKRTGPVFEESSSKRQKSTAAPIPTVPEVPQSPVVSSPHSSGIRRKSLGNRLTKPKSKHQELDLDADDQMFIKVVSDENFDDEAPRLWSALVGWEVITTPLGDINALYRIDRSMMQ